MADRTQKEKAIQFRQMHTGPEMLVLPNVWDAASARVLEQAGFQVIATTSSGVAASLGYPDGQHISRDMLFDIVEGIVRVVDCPVSVDLEAGYGDTIEEVMKTVGAIIRAGADCIFPIGVSDAPTIAQLVKAIAGPVNIVAGPPAPTLPELAQLGVARISFASGLMRATLGHLQQIARELLKKGTYTGIGENIMSGMEFRSLFEER